MATFVRTSLDFTADRRFNKAVDRVNPLVIDGVTLRCPVCAVNQTESGDPCKEPLEHPHDKYCRTHAFKDNKCFVLTCPREHEPRSWACADEAHKTLARKRAEEQLGGAQQLLRRLGRSGVSEHPMAGLNQREGPQDGTTAPQTGHAVDGIASAAQTVEGPHQTGDGQDVTTASQTTSAVVRDEATAQTIAGSRFTEGRQEAASPDGVETVRQGAEGEGPEATEVRESNHCIANVGIACDGEDSVKERGEAKGKKGKQKASTAYVERHFLHNDQLAVRVCGMIIGRMAMYGAEGVRSVIVRRRPAQRI